MAEAFLWDGYNLDFPEWFKELIDIGSANIIKISKIGLTDEKTVLTIDNGKKRKSIVFPGFYVLKKTDGSVVACSAEKMEIQ